jgi:hypothetical protein
MALGCLAKRRNVRNVLRPSRRDLLGHKVSAGNKKRRESALWIDDAFNAPFPCGVKFNAVDAGENIDRTRFTSEPDEVAWVGKVFHTNVIEESAEVGQRRISSFCFCCIGFDEQVNIRI